MSLFFFKMFIYLCIHERHRERGRDPAEGEAGSMQGAGRGTRSQDSRITPWAEGGAKPLSHPGCPTKLFLKLPAQGHCFPPLHLLAQQLAQSRYS